MGCGRGDGGTKLCVTCSLCCEPIFSTNIAVTGSSVLGTRSALDALAAKGGASSDFCTRQIL